ncbi:MAG: S8 family serine peptidase [Paludisphaera borealis]|uniref:S8 family serine peptidase n=1 Tax=Paludisphaera borealis TaxID=1387353 RepID=UPI00284304A5|nr:S8 family serine peptidase [Paludisphaera borealis]MDR3622964.1 S8 family serine peptidase [Paludisphaera borealis]
MERTAGRSEVVVGLIDGPVRLDHAGLSAANIRALPGRGDGGCLQADSLACRHGTFIAGVLVAKRGSVAPALCPGCTLLVRPLFAETTTGSEGMPDATPEELADAVLESMAAGARVLNLSVGLARISSRRESALEAALDEAARRGVLVIVAAGNQGTVGSSALTRHPWVIPVVACDGQGRPTPESNLGSSIGRRGLSAPGDAVTSLGTTGPSMTTGGTSVAVPFVTGTIALLWSEFPDASAVAIKLALTRGGALRRSTVVPPLLDAGPAYESLRQTYQLAL